MEQGLDIRKPIVFEGGSLTFHPTLIRVFTERLHLNWKKPSKSDTIHAYLGIDSGSTTTTFVLMDEKEQILDSFYAPNQGNPL